MFFSNKLSAVVVKAFRVVNTFSRLNISSSKIGFSWGGAVVVAQLVERLLTNPKITV